MIWPHVLFGLGMVLCVVGFLLCSVENDRLLKHQIAEDRLIADIKAFNARPHQ